VSRANPQLVLPGVLWVLALALPAEASRPDSWEGHLFLRDVTDLLAFPHRAVEDRDVAVGTHVPSVSTGVTRAFGDDAENSLEVAGLLSIGLGERFGAFFAANDPRGYNPSVTAGWANANSDFTYFQDPLITTPRPTVDVEWSAMNVAVSGIREIGNGGTVAASLGIVRYTDKFESRYVAGFESIIVDETITVNPACSSPPTSRCPASSRWPRG
jgi:hypothetical protein